MKGLLSVSFGTSYEDTRVKTIDIVDGLLAKAFPDCAFYTAWTSERIVKKVREERGEVHDTLEEAFARLSADGVNELVVATMCLMNSHEMSKIKKAAEQWCQADGARSVRVATSLLFDDEDRKAVAQAICDEFSALPDDEALLLMGHGSTFGANEVYHQIQGELTALGRKRFFVATVEGEPTFDDALELIAAQGIRRIQLAPLMIVAGDHARNDLAGDDEDSWKSMLEARGFSVEVTLKGLGEYAAIQQLVVDHARAAYSKEENGVA